MPLGGFTGISLGGSVARVDTRMVWHMKNCKRNRDVFFFLLPFKHALVNQSMKTGGG